MHYDPIKKKLGNIFNQTPFLRKLFYKLLDLLLLRAWYIKKEIKKLYKNNRSAEIEVLDAGAGFGQYTFFVSSYLKNSKTTAVDVKEEQIEDCNNFFKKINREDRVKFEIGDLTKYKTEQKYSLVLSVDVMEHILEDTLVFSNLCQSMKKDGVLLISTPSDQGGSDVHDDDEESFISEHVRDGYNINEIEEKLLKAGFSKVEKKYSYGTFGSIAWKLSMKWPILMLNKSMLFGILLIPYYLIAYPIAFILNFIDTNTNCKTGTGLIVKAIK